MKTSKKPKSARKPLKKKASDGAPALPRKTTRAAKTPAKPVIRKSRRKKPAAPLPEAPRYSDDPLQSDRDYVYERFVQLYQHSRKARHSLAALSMLPERAPKRRYARSTTRQELAEFDAGFEHESGTARAGWWHKPYPYSGHFKLFKIVFSVVVLTVIVQIIYPSGLTLPLSRLEGNGFAGLKSKGEIERKADFINNRLMTVNTKDSRVTATPREMGVKVNGEETFRELSDYPLGKRLIPFSILLSSVKSKPVSRDINVDRLEEFTESIITVTSREPKDAAVSLQGTKFVISPSVEGYDYEQKEIRRQIARTPLGDEPVSLQPRLTLPKLTTETAEESIIAMQKRIDSGLTVAAADQHLRISPETVASWVRIVHKPDIKTVELTFDREKVTESLKPLAGMVNNPGTPDQITLLNEAEAGRRQGSPGRTLNFDDLVNQVASADDWTVGLIQADVATDPIKQVYNHTYTRDSVGAQSLVDYWARNNRGRVGVDFRTQNGRISASYNSYQQFAGAHKLYLPHLVYGQINTRKLNPGATTSAKFTVSGCIEKLVLSGHDGCANALGDLVGWGDNNSLLVSQGMTGTTLGRGSGATSAHDGAEWASKLLSGSLTTLAQRSSLIGLMSEQSLRGGIPAGAKGTAVANRAGQAGNIRYDVAIVYHPQGTYVLSVFSDGSSFNAIADLASQVNKLMGQ